ncbi:MAG: TraR/DksA family transcriptional regulator [Acidobacteria bacterium]|nr:TraR/DksA family transcriptional regulator [Acidobacteriota bacterium]
MRKPTNGTKGAAIRAYRIELLNKKMDLLMSLGFNFKKLAEADRNSDDDLMVALQDEVLHSGLDRVLYDQLREVESALARLGSGEYGSCANCGSPISAKRLQAIPWATHCVDCKDNAFAGQPQATVSLGQELC